MPIVIGYMIGKMIGRFIVAILTMMFRLLHILLFAAARVLKYGYLGLSWFIGKLWEEGCERY